MIFLPASPAIARLRVEEPQSSALTLCLFSFPFSHICRLKRTPWVYDGVFCNLFQDARTLEGLGNSHIFPERILRHLKMEHIAQLAYQFFGGLFLQTPGDRLGQIGGFWNFPPYIYY